MRSLALRPVDGRRRRISPARILGRSAENDREEDQGNIAQARARERRAGCLRVRNEIQLRSWPGSWSESMRAGAPIVRRQASAPAGDGQAERWPPARSRGTAPFKLSPACRSPLFREWSHRLPWQVLGLVSGLTRKEIAGIIQYYNLPIVWSYYFEFQFLVEPRNCNLPRSK